MVVNAQVAMSDQAPLASSGDICVPWSHLYNPKAHVGSLHIAQFI
jgi:hypothetical protein